MKKKPFYPTLITFIGSKPLNTTNTKLVDSKGVIPTSTSVESALYLKLCRFLLTLLVDYQQGSIYFCF